VRDAIVTTAEASVGGTGVIGAGGVTVVSGTPVSHPVNGVVPSILK